MALGGVLGMRGQGIRPGSYRLGHGKKPWAGWYGAGWGLGWVVWELGWVRGFGHERLGHEGWVLHGKKPWAGFYRAGFAL